MVDNGKKVISAHSKLTVNGVKGQQIGYVAYVMDDLGFWHTNSKGEVVKNTYTNEATYENTCWNDIEVYLYNYKLDPKPGKHVYSVYLFVYYDGNYYGKTLAGTYEMTGAGEDPDKLSAEDAYQKGESLYSDKSYSSALPYLNSSARRGHKKAQFRLGYLYYKGFGVTVDYTSAREWYEKAAAQGHATAQNNLGVLYEDGYGVKPDRNQAIAWYTKAANNGNDKAKENLARLKGTNSTTTNNNTAGTVRQNTGSQISKRFYNTWWASFTDGSFGVAGNGWISITPVFHITDSRISVSEYSEADDKWVYEFEKTNPDGSRVYSHTHYISPTIYIKRDLILSADKKAITMQSRVTNTRSSISNFVDDPELRKIIIAENNSRVSAPNQALFNSLMESPYASWVNPNDVRGTEHSYDKYRDKDGNFSEKKYWEVTRKECNYCRGTGVDPTPLAHPGTRGKTSNAAGNKCGYCGNYTLHYHQRCPSCSKN